MKINSSEILFYDFPLIFGSIDTKDSTKIDTVESIILIHCMWTANKGRASSFSPFSCIRLSLFPFYLPSSDMSYASTNLHSRQAGRDQLTASRLPWPRGTAVRRSRARPSIAESQGGREGPARAGPIVQLGVGLAGLQVGPRRTRLGSSPNETGTKDDTQRLDEKSCCRIVTADIKKMIRCKIYPSSLVEL